MSPTREIEGKNVDQAVQKACQLFNVSPGELKYDILSYGSSGIFGLGRTRKARIRVRLNEKAVISEDADPIPDRGLILEPGDSVTQNGQPSAGDSMDDGTSSSGAEDAVGPGQEVLQRIVDAITDDARITVERQSERIVFRVAGGNSALLIGRHGQTLEAIQSLVEKVVNKNNSNRLRVQVDVGGYLKNRKKRLIRNAERLAQKCRRTKKPVSAGLLNAYDRRIVHLALKDNQRVRTHSTGDGLMRKLMILPLKSAGRESDQKKR